MCPSIGWVNHLVHTLSKKEFMGKLPFWIIIHKHSPTVHLGILIVYPKILVNHFALQVSWLQLPGHQTLVSYHLVGVGCLVEQFLVLDAWNYAHWSMIWNASLLRLARSLSCVIGIMCHFCCYVPLELMQKTTCLYIEIVRQLI